MRADSGIEQDARIEDRVLASVHRCEVVAPPDAGYLFSAAAPGPTLMALCFAILTMELYGELPDAARPEWEHTLLAAQDQDTGLFVDPLLSVRDLVPTSPGMDYLYHQTSYFALNALDALGHRPRYLLRFADPFRDREYLGNWLEGLDWSDPWKESNWVMFIAAALYATWQWEEEPAIAHALHALLDWLDGHQDPETGFWGLRLEASLLEKMAAAYHFLPFYFCMGRALHHPERMIESTLSLQQPDGLFHPDGGGDTCLDVDAVDILVKCSLVTPHLAPQVEKALGRAYHAILGNIAESGGFCRARHRPLPPKTWKRRLAEAVGLDRLLGKPYVGPREVWEYSGWAKMPFDIRKADLWSTWFRSYGLAVISERYPGKFPTTVRWRFRRLPALGWQDEHLIERSCCDDARV
jgi:hypothetical protein